MYRTPQEQKLIDDARSELRTWRYMRWIWLFVALFALGVAIDLQFSDSVFGLQAQTVLQALLSALGLQGIIWAVLNWDNGKTRLLVRLADERTKSVD